MPDYSKGVIYTIRCHSDTSLIYVGSTIQPLYKRWGGHKNACFDPNSGGYNMNIYQMIRGTGWDDWYIELYEEYPCDNVQQLHKREGEVIREIGNLNKRIAGRDKKQYQEENKEKIKQYREENKEKLCQQMKQYYEENKEKIKQNMKQYREENKGKIDQQMKQYREENKGKIDQYHKQYYEENKEKIKQKDKQYREENKEIINEKAREKVMCECGANVSRRNISAHRKTQKHILWQATQTAATN